MYDVIIIGAGPAGISASLYAKRANSNVLVLYHNESTLEQAEKIDNYYGFPGGISGKDLYMNGIQQAKELEIDLKEEEVLKIVKNDEIFTITTTYNEYNSKAVILSTGNKKIKPNIKGLKEFEGKGISYCAICDAFFYRNKNVAVIGNGQYAVKEAEELSNVVNSVSILTNGLIKPECGFSVNDSIIKEFSGDSRIRKIIFEDNTEMEIDGIFIALGEAGAIDFAKAMGIILDGETIVVDEKMETNIKGVFACGNITGGLQQICKAVHEGAEAGMSAVKYIKEES